MFLLFAGLVGSAVLVLLIWAGVMVYRLYNPDQALSFEERPLIQRERARARDDHVSVGVQGIRSDRRREQGRSAVEAEYVWERSDGIPESWHRDLWHRRN